MTGRRSLQYHSARESRTLQFIPGHVGGRVASAQPVARRSTIGGVAHTEPPPIPPTGMRYIDVKVDIAASGTSSLYVNLNAGEKVILFAGVDSTQSQTIGPAWTTLDTTIISAMRCDVVTMQATSTGSVLVSSTGPEASTFNSLSAQGFAFTGGEFNFSVNVIGTTISSFVTLHEWAGSIDALRIRALMCRGAYNNWVGGDAYTAGHSHLDLGYLTPETSLYKRWVSLALPAYLTQSWIAGTFQHHSIGVAGTPRWIEYHVQLIGGGF